MSQNTFRNEFKFQLSDYDTVLAVVKQSVEILCNKLVQLENSNIIQNCIRLLIITPSIDPDVGKQLENMHAKLIETYLQHNTSSKTTNRKYRKYRLNLSCSKVCPSISLPQVSYINHTRIYLSPPATCQTKTFLQVSLDIHFVYYESFIVQ